MKRILVMFLVAVSLSACFVPVPVGQAPQERLVVQSSAPVAASPSEFQPSSGSGGTTAQWVAQVTGDCKVDPQWYSQYFAGKEVLEIKSGGLTCRAIVCGTFDYAGHFGVRVIDQGGSFYVEWPNGCSDFVPTLPMECAAQVTLENKIFLGDCGSLRPKPNFGPSTPVEPSSGTTHRSRSLVSIEAGTVVLRDPWCVSYSTISGSYQNPDGSIANLKQTLGGVYEIPFDLASGSAVPGGTLVILPDEGQWGTIIYDQ